MDLIPFFLMAPLLIAAAYCDLRFMRIPNLISLIAIAIFLITLPFFPPSHLMLRLAIAALVFAAGFTAFALGMVGGGDVKFLSALVLFVPPAQMTIFANIFSVAMLVGIMVILTFRRVPATRLWGWKSLSGSKGFPMGLSIAMAGLVFPFVALSLQH